VEHGTEKEELFVVAQTLRRKNASATRLAARHRRYQAPG
jgi:hypothetical protein